MEVWKIILLLILFFFVIDILFLPRIKPTKQDKRREAYQKRIKDERAKRQEEKDKTER